MADGAANRAHRLRALGNTIVPQIPELIGRAIMETYNAEVSGAGTASAGLPGYDACGNGERK
jgi:hypothetical protein